MNELVKQLQNSLSRKIIDCKEEDLDKHYMTTSRGSFTRRELYNEIKNGTEIGLQQMESILKLTIYLLERNKETI